MSNTIEKDSNGITADNGDIRLPQTTVKHEWLTAAHVVMDEDEVKVISLTRINDDTGGSKPDEKYNNKMTTELEVPNQKTTELQKFVESQIIWKYGNKMQQCKL